MSESCSCGAVLVEDARFCHRCGKPHGESLLPPETAPEPPVAPVARVVAPAPAVSWHDPLAVRVALLTASVTAVPYLLLALMGPLLLVWFAGGGFSAVTLYRRHSGRVLTRREGARLGWLNGLIAFLIATVFFSVYLLFSGINGLRDMLISGLPHDAPRYQQVSAMYQDPAVFGLAVVFAWVFLGALAALGSVAGGAFAGVRPGITRTPRV